MRHWTRKAGIVPVAALAAALSGCDLEVLNPGAIQDADLNTPELMPILANGVSAEFNDLQDALVFTIMRLTDEAAGTGSYTETQVFRQGIFDWEDSDTYWEQGHEAAWAAEQAWERFQEVLGADANTSPDAAKLFVLRGMAFRTLGENFCHFVYRVGPGQDRTAAFDLAISSFQEAITIGQAAGTAGAHWVTAARAGMAQAYVGKGDWTTAVTWANQVPTNFVDAAIYHEQANINVAWSETWGRAEVGVYNTLAARMADAGDTRTSYTKCGEWNNPGDPYPAIIAGGVTSTGNCTGQGSGAHQGADGDHAHYRQNKYTDRGADIPRATGAEMRLIEAEAFLRNNDLTNFINKINELRAFYSLGALAEPATAGALEFPTEYPGTDGWSILDAERMASLWLTGKRLYDLDRWDHPFLTGGWIVGGSAQSPRRDSCMPVTRTECNLNPELNGNATVCTG